MAVNPLLLTMIATVHRRGSALPGKRVDLYKEICHVLLEKRQRAKFSNSEDINESLTAPQKQSVLQVLALELMQGQTRTFQVTQAASLIRDQLTLVAGSNITPSKFLEQVKDINGLLVEKEIGIYEFAHLSFQEYLAAVQIDKSNQEQLLLTNLDNSWWHETIRLYAAQSNSTNIIRVALANPTVASMALAYDCLEEGMSVDAEVRQQLEVQLEEDLESR